MSSQRHPFPLHRQIVWSVRIFTAISTLAVGAALFLISERYVRTNTLQATEFNLRLVASSIESNLDSADDLLNWATVDSTLRRYLTRGEVNGAQTLAAYNAAQEKYLSSPLQSRIIRFFVTNETDRFLQFGSLLPNSAALNRSSAALFLKQGYGTYLARDPLLAGQPECLVLCRPIRASTGTMHRGTVYLGLDLSVIVGPAAGYQIPEGGILYWKLSNRLWKIEDGRLTECENLLSGVEYTSHSVASSGNWQQSAMQGRIVLDGKKYLVVEVSLDGRGASLVQLMPESTFLTQDALPLGLILLGLAVIWGLSWLLKLWLERAITRPVETLQNRIAAVGAGDFTADPAIEWDNELGDIGRGINKLSADLSSTLAARIEDERRKQDLEYRMLQNEVNPHFIYNTLNSIRWMATIQNAPGIAEMAMAFARLTKSISKSTRKLVSLQEELSLLNDYFTIQQYRYGGDITIEVAHIEDEALCQSCRIPRFTLQPLAENAIFHGIEPKGGSGSVLLEIRTDPDSGDLMVTMTDDGVGMAPDVLAHALDEPDEETERQEKFRHVGLWNVHRRIQYSFGPQYGLSLESEPDVGTAVTIRLPLGGNEETEHGEE